MESHSIPSFVSGSLYSFPIAALANYHKQQFKATHVYYFTVLWVWSPGIMWLSWVICLRFLKVQIIRQLCAPNWKFWEIICFQAHSGCWQILVPCCCRTEVSFPCWLAAGGHLRGLTPTGAHSLLDFRTVTVYQMHLESFGLLLLLHAGESSVLLRDHRD